MTGALPQAPMAGRRPRFQAGGALGEGALYVERAADRELFDALRRGELCHVLSTRQIGKSSLRLRTTRRLTAEGIACVTIDLTALGTENTSPETWYVGLTAEIALGLDLPPPDAFWDQHRALGPVHAFSRYIEDEVLTGIEGRIVLFIDEIDATLSLPFARDDFFAAVRAFYNRRSDRPANERLTFCLLGVAAPGDLISDPTRTPFNVGRAIRLEDFTRAETAALAEGLEGSAEARAALLDEVFAWASGHPYMTQRICDALMSEARGQPVDEVVQAKFLERGRTEDANLQYAERWFDEARLRKPGSRVPKMLRLYRQLLSGEEVLADGADPVQLGLRLTGLAAERDQPRGPRRLAVRSRVFERVFDLSWARKKEAGRVIAEPLARWLDSGQKEGFLVSGEALREVQVWAEGREDLNADERVYLQASERAEQTRARAEERRRAQRTLVGTLVLMITLLAGALGLALWQTEIAKQAQQEAETSAAKATEQSKLTDMEARRGNVRRLAALADAAGTQYPQRRLLLGLESYRAAREAGASLLVVAEQAIRDGAREVSEHRVVASHEGRVNSAVYSPDGKSILTVSEDKTARVWQADGSGEMIILRGHEGKVYLAVFSPDGQRVVTASEDKTARVWNADGSGEPILLQGHEGEVNRAVFSPDGQHVVTASDDKTARVWNADGSGEPSILRGHEGRVYEAVFSPDGQHILTSSRDNTARVWNADGSGEAVVLRGPKHRIRKAMFSPDARRALVVFWDGSARMWDTGGTGHSFVSSCPRGWISGADFSPDGKRFVVGCNDNTARVWSADGTGTPIILRGHESTVISAIYSPDGEHILTTSYDSTARVWNADGSGTSIPLRGPESLFRDAVLSPDGRRVFALYYDGTARLWNADGSGEPISLRGHDHEITSARFSPDGQHLLTASGGTVRLWNVDGSGGEPAVLRADGLDIAVFSPDGQTLFTASGRKKRVLRADGSGTPVILGDDRAWVHRAVFSPDGRRVLTTDFDGLVRILNADGSGDPIVLRGHTQYINGAVFSHDGHLVLTASDDKTARVWNADGSGEPIVLRGHEDSINGAVFSPDGHLVLTASDDKTARVWNTDGSGEPLLLCGHTESVNSAHFSPDGHLVLTVSGDKTARVWNVDGTGRPIVLRGHERGLAGAVFSPGGQHVLTASYDDTARVWNADGSGEPIVLRGHEDSVRTAVFSSDGDRIVTASVDKTARLWRSDGSGEPTVLGGHQGPVRSAVFSPDGMRILTVSDAPWFPRRDIGTARLWTLDIDVLLQKACQYAGRNLTRIEWARFLPGEPYRKTCPEWPEDPEPTPSTEPNETP